MGIGLRSHTLTATLVQIAFGVLILTTIVVVLCLVLRGPRFRNRKFAFHPIAYLKRKWRGGSSEETELQKYSRTSRGMQSVPTIPSLSQEETLQAGSDTAVVDRHTSVRSIATLPAYKSTAHDTEQILGREGERGGIDVVIEFPETAEEEETRRDEDMEALYQIRLARRTLATERQERRRLRREARDRGDLEALEILRIMSRSRAESAARLTTLAGAAGASNSSLPSSVLTAEHLTPLERERRIPSVSYADVGLARHDGTRVRASSDGADFPLLEGAALMGSSGSRPGSPFRGRDYPQTSQHRDSSMHSTSSNGSDLMYHATTDGSARPTHSRTTSNLSNTIRPDDTEEDDDDVNDVIPSEPPEYEHIPLNEPHQDEAAPPYESPTAASRPTMPLQQSPRDHNNPNDAPQLPALRALPAIEITAGTPSNSNPASPVRRTGVGVGV